MFGWITDKLFLGCLAALLLIAGIFYLYFHISQKQIEALNQQIAGQKVAIQEQKSTIDSLQTVAKQQKADIETLQTKMSASEAAHAKLVAQVHSLNIAQNAQKNRAQMQTNLNQQLSTMFSNTPTGGTPDAKH
jgi:septal ring factor EnvC (AmiA/AmiB activator)